MPRLLTAILLTALVATAFTACDKAPRGVISERKMARLLADFAKAETVIEQHPEQFPDDSAKLLLKQSILKKYDADLAMYDSSLVWYGHHLDIYVQVHDRAIALLEKEQKSGSAGGNDDDWTATATPVPGQGTTSGARRIYPATGDSANVWKEPQQWLLTSVMNSGYITWDYTPDAESRPGDLYTINMKMTNTGNVIHLFMAADYSDGTTGYADRTVSVSGWQNYMFQSDSARHITRLYGYIHYNIKPQSITLIDSIYLLRTHLDPSRYSMINMQKWVGPKAIVETAKPGAPATPAPAPNPAGIKPRDSVFVPKPGLNKGGPTPRERAMRPSVQPVPPPAK